MRLLAKPASNQETHPFRCRYREEMNCQIVKDSIHRREGWMRSFLLERNGIAVGFGSIAFAGPWKDKPTILEFWVVPEHRPCAFGLFETFLAASGAQFFETQTNDPLLPVMAHT